MEPKQVLTVISNENRRTPHRVVINTYAVIDGKFQFHAVFVTVEGWDVEAGVDTGRMRKMHTPPKSVSVAGQLTSSIL